MHERCVSHGSWEWELAAWSSEEKSSPPRSRTRGHGLVGPCRDPPRAAAQIGGARTSGSPQHVRCTTCRPTSVRVIEVSFGARATTGVPPASPATWRCLRSHSRPVRLGPSPLRSHGSTTPPFPYDWPWSLSVFSVSSFHFVCAERFFLLLKFNLFINTRLYSKWAFQIY